MVTPDLLAAWETTRVEIGWLHGVQVLPSIREGLRGASVEALGPSVSGHVVTAWNPDAQVLASWENAARHAALREVVAAAGLACVPAVGRACDGSWHEEGLFVVARGSLVVARAAALALGRQFQQLGIYEVEGGRVWALACADGAVVAPVGTPVGMVHRGGAAG